MEDIEHCRRQEEGHVLLIWRTEAAFERDWIRWLLSAWIDDEVEDPERCVFCDNAIVVDSFLTRARAKHMHGFRGMSSVGLVHLSDETYRDHYAAYVGFGFVLRNYWADIFLSERVACVPLGWRSGFGSVDRHRPAGIRPFVWSFAGQPDKTTRPAMLNALLPICPNYVHRTRRFADDSGLSAQRYQALLTESMFAPCPMGFVNLETFRVWEALECGAIPIVERRRGFDYFARMLGEHPLITVETWVEAAEAVRELCADLGRLEAHQSTCIRWWQRTKTAMRLKVDGLIRRPGLVDWPISRPMAARWQLARHAPSPLHHALGAAWGQLRGRHQPAERR